MTVISALSPRSGWRTLIRGGGTCFLPKNGRRDQGNDQADREGLSESYCGVDERVVIHCLKTLHLLQLCIDKLSSGSRQAQTPLSTDYADYTDWQTLKTTHSKASETLTIFFLSLMFESA